jgi:hypothetical protein
MRTLALLSILAQVLSSQVARQPHRPPEALGLVDQARALPAEFHADALLRVAGSSLVTEASWKEELIEEAFWFGSHASLPYMQHAEAGSDSVAVNAVRANRLEALTLQTEAVQAMLSLNSGKALRLFEQIPPFILPKLTCASVSTPDVVDYYQTAVFVFEGSFTPEQRTQGQDVALLRQLVASVETPVQVPPVLEMLFAVNLAPVQRDDLLLLLGGELEGIFRSDREYGAAETALVSAFTREDIRPDETAIFLPALRSYIVRHVSSHRCTDNTPPVGKLAKSAEQFNTLVGKLDPTKARYKQISAEEAKPTGDDGTYKRTLIGQSPQSEAIHDALRWLTHGDRVTPDGKVLRWTVAERSSQNWLEHFDDASKLVHDLKESDEASPEAFFCEKSDALNILAALAPPSPTRDRAMEEYREFLEDYYPSIQNPNLWFTMFRHMLYTARFGDDPKDRVWILEQLARSSNPIIAVYAKLEKRIGPPAETYPTSHVQTVHR